jgi:hypothetical protein
MTVASGATLDLNSFGQTIGSLSGSGAVTLGSATLTNVTITANSSGLAGGGISNIGGTTRLENTLVANASMPAGQDCFGTITSAGGNLDSGTSCGFSTLTDISNTDPLLGLLTTNGGRTPTHALLAGSPAIDAAQPSPCPATDQRLSRAPCRATGATSAHTNYCDSHGQSETRIRTAFNRV